MENYKISTVTYYSEYGCYTFLSGEHLTRDFASGSHWEKDTIEKLLKIVKEDWVIISVGTHVGTTLIPLAKKVNTCYAFEGQKIIYQLLLNNLYKNNITNVIPINGIVSHSTVNKSTMSLVPDFAFKNKNGYNYGGVQIGKGGDLVNVYKLNNLNIQKFDLLFIDAEGSEDYVIKSGDLLIKNFLPIIIMEINDVKPTKEMKKSLGLDENYNFDKINFLKKLNYTTPCYLSGDNYIFLNYNNHFDLKFNSDYTSGDSIIKVCEGKVQFQKENIICDICKLDDENIILLSNVAYFGCINNGDIYWNNNTIWKKI